MDRLRIGVIGLGWFGEIHCETIVGIPNMELAALCTRTPDRLAQQAEKFGVKKTYRDYRDMLADKDIDAVSIVTMWDQHTDPTIAALEAGKHVFLEKPMASTVADCRKIMAASKNAKGVLQIGHIVRFNPRYRMAKQAIDEGKIGKIVALSSRRNIPAAWTPEILNKIGPIVGDAIHDTDIMLWFTGDTVASAYAQTVSVRNLKFPDIGQTMYRFKGGATATLETVWCMPEKTPFDIDERMSIIGTRRHHPRPGHVPQSGDRLRRQAAQPGHDLLADVRRCARRGAARGTCLFRALRAEGRDPGHRAAGRRCGGAGGDACGGGIGPHGQGHSHRLIWEKK